MPLRTLPLGSSHTPVPALGVGLMSLGHAYGHAGDDSTRLAYLDSLYAMGETFWDSANIYGDNEVMLGKWFEANPEKRKDIFLSTKFAIVLNEDGTRGVRSDAAYVKESIERSLSKLKTDYVDLYYCHRTDGKTPVEETVRAMLELKKQGKIHHIGLSEVTAKDLKRACAIAPIDALQSEYNPWALEVETLGILDICRQHNITLVAYSPLGRGFLTGQIRTLDDIKSDVRAHFPRFAPQNFQKNFDVVEKLEEIAKKKGVKAGQLGLAWLMKQAGGGTVLPIFGTRSVERVKENLVALDVELSEEDEKTIRSVVDEAGKADLGARYPEGMSWELRDTPEEK